MLYTLALLGFVSNTAAFYTLYSSVLAALFHCTTFMLTFILNNVWSILLIIFFFGGSIFVHEYGHFLAARKRGLKVERFSIGFGPKLYSWVKDGVEYRLSLLPLGGYVALPQLGDMEAIEGKYDKSTLPPISYSDKIIVVVMGAVFNILFAFVLATILWIVGLPVAPKEKTTTLGYVASKVFIHADETVVGPAYAQGLRPGDTIVAVDGKPVDDFSSVRKYIALGSGRSAQGRPQVVLSILREGKLEDVCLEPVLVETNSLSKDALRVAGIEPAETLKIGATHPGSPAQKAGLEKGDILLKANGEKLYSLHSLSDLIQDKTAEPIEVEVLRNGTSRTVTVLLEQLSFTKPLLSMSTQAGESLSLLPYSGSKSEAMPLKELLEQAPVALYEASPTFREAQTGDILMRVNDKPLHSFRDLETMLPGLEPASPLKLVFQRPKGETYSLELVYSETLYTPSRTQALIGIELDQSPIVVYESPFKQIGKTVAMTYQTLSSLIHRNTDIHLKHLMGPPGIMRAFHNFSTSDIRLVLWFTLMLNINLAIINLLPIPVLDGGHILFATLGKIFGKDIPSALIAKIQATFMVLLFSVMLYASFFDICRWQGDRQDNKAFEKEKLLYIRPQFEDAKP